MAASHRSLIQDQISDVTECSICAEVFTNPKILPCVHTFCLHCLETYGKQKNPGEQMVCPICRREFLIPNGGFSNLPSNFFIGKMVEIAKQSMTPDIKSPCALCPDEDAVLAQLFCVDCEQHLCSRCGSIHKKSKCSKSHHMVELGSQLNAKELNLRTSYCDHHPGEQIKMYCYEDKVAICLICCVESHQSHRCVNANKAAGEFTEELKCRSVKVASRIAECEELVEKLEKFKKEFQTKVLKTEEGIREAANKMTKLIQQHTEQMVQRLKSVAEKNIKAFETTRQDVDRFRVMIDSYSRYTEKLLMQGSPVDICRAVDQMLTRAQELETLPVNCSGNTLCCDTIAFNPLNIERKLFYGMSNVIGDLIVTPSSDWLLQFGVQDESKVTDPCVVEVQGLPETANDTGVTIIFENKRYCGIEEVIVDQVQMLGGGRAQLTIKEPQHANALIKKGSIMYKKHKLTISRPSKLKESVQRPFSLKDLNETPGGNVTDHEQSISDESIIVVNNIPEDMAENSLMMIFESKRFGGGGEVKDIIYDKERGLAVLTLSDPEVARRLLHQESVIFKDARLTIKKHVEDRSRKPFPARKRSNVPTNEKEQPSTSDRTIKISGIPSDIKKDTLQMVFECKRYSGGETCNIVYNQGTGTAVITFKDPEVARTLLQKEVLCYKGNQFGITMYADEPAEDSTKDQAPAVSGRMVDVSDIPSNMTTEELTMLLENKSDGGEIESIDHNQSHSTAIATFRDSAAADVLMSKGSLLIYKGNRLSITRHLETLECQRIPIQTKEVPPSSNRMPFPVKFR